MGQGNDPLGTLQDWRAVAIHEAAFRWVQEYAQKLGPFDKVIEIGSYNINGSVRPLFGNCEYVGIDKQGEPEDGVDWQGDAVDYEPPEKVDCVVCCEVLEHAPNWKEIINKACEWLDDDGTLLITCAGPGRKPHSAVDGSYNVRDWEHYQNVSTYELARELAPHFIVEGTASVGIQVRQYGEDTQVVAERRSYGD